MPPDLLMSSRTASYHFFWSSGWAMPKTLLAAGPTTLVSVTATLICVAETPGTFPDGDGHPRAVGPAAGPVGAAPPGRGALPAAAAEPVADAAPGVAASGVDPAACCGASASAIPADS